MWYSNRAKKKYVNVVLKEKKYGFSSVGNHLNPIEKLHLREV